MLLRSDGLELTRIDVREFLKQSEELFKYIKKGASGHGAYEIPSKNNFLKKIHCEKIKAKSKNKADINLIIHDYHTGLQPELAFSIKSNAGAKPTLLNASSATTVMFKIDGGVMDDLNADRINSITGESKIQVRVCEIGKLNNKLIFQGLESNVFSNNLRMLDCCMPEMIAWLLSDCYMNRDMNIMKAIGRIRKAKPLKFINYLKSCYK